MEVWVAFWSFGTHRSVHMWLLQITRWTLYFALADFYSFKEELQKISTEDGQLRIPPNYWMWHDHTILIRISLCIQCIHYTLCCEQAPVQECLETSVNCWKTTFLILHVLTPSLELPPMDIITRMIHTRRWTLDLLSIWNLFQSSHITWIWESIQSRLIWPLLNRVDEL